MDGRWEGKPFQYDLWWISLFLEQDPAWDWRTLTYAGFEQFFTQAVEMYGSVLGADDPDLSAFADSGGKALLTRRLCRAGSTPGSHPADRRPRRLQHLRCAQDDGPLGHGHC